MIIQPFVENAIKHGLAPKQGKRILVLEFRITNESLNINILDNGSGLKSSSRIKPCGAYHQSRGIKNTTERIEYFARDYNVHTNIEYGVEIRNRYKKGESKGVSVNIILPVIEG